MFSNRKINLFEKLLLPAGMALIFIGLYLIFLAEQAGTILAWVRLGALFFWMLLLFVVIQTAISENMKEELAMLQSEHMLEIKLLRDAIKQHLEQGHRKKK